MRMLLTLAVFLATPAFAQPPVSTAPPADAAALSAAVVPAPADAPSGPGADFLGLDEAAVRSRLGAPDIARAEGTGALWTYRRTGCALFVFFQTRPGEGLRVSGVDAGALDLAAAEPELAACLAGS